MEDGIKTTMSTQSVQNESENQGGKVLAGGVFEERREMESVWNPEKIRRELLVLSWALSLGQDHIDFGFFRGGECKNCTGCSDEFHFLHYTSEKNAYCVKCYLDGFCTVIEDDSIFLVVIKKSERILIEIQKS
jgi:hypothetical protein